MQIKVIDHEGKMYDLSIKEFFTVQMIRIKLKQEYNLNTDRCYLFRSGQILDDETLLKANSNEPIIIFDRQIFPDMSYPSIDNEFCLDFSRYSDCFVNVSQINSVKKSSENNNNENISNINNLVNDQRTLQMNNSFSYDEQESENSENDSDDNNENSLNETSSHHTTENSYAERYHNLIGQALNAMNMLSSVYQMIDQINSQIPDSSIFNENEGAFVEDFLRTGIEGLGQILSDSFQAEEQINNEQNRHFEEEDESYSQIEENSQGRQLEQEYVRLLIENVNLLHQRQQYERELRQIEEQNHQQQNFQIEEQNHQQQNFQIEEQNHHQQNLQIEEQNHQQQNLQIEELQNQLNQLEDEYRRLTISSNELEQQSESLSQEYQRLVEQFREQQRIHEQEIIIDNQNRQNEEIVSHTEEQSSQIGQLDNLSLSVIDRSETEQNRLNDELDRLEEMFHNLQFDISTQHPLNLEEGRPRNSQNNDLHQTLLELERMQSELQIMNDSNHETQQHLNENSNTNTNNSNFLEQLRLLMNVSSSLMQHDEEGEEESIDLGVDLNNLSDVNNYIAKGFDPNANINEDDNIAISQLLQFGYDRVTVIMLYLSCNKDKERAMNLLTSLNE